MAKRKKSGAPHMDERWAVSYSDMMTVLMALFLVLYAMSDIDKGKYEILKNSLQTGFAVQDQKKIEELLNDPQPDAKAKVETPMQKLAKVKQKLESEFAKAGLDQDIEVTVTERGITIRLAAAESFFAPNSSALMKKAHVALAASAKVLKSTHYEIRVEGHADYRTGTGTYPTNWELSSDRAVKVLRYLVNQGIDDKLIGATGYGSSRPMVKGKADSAMAKNRRTDIIVLAPDALSPADIATVEKESKAATSKH